MLCITCCQHFKQQTNAGGSDNEATEPDKGSAEPLSRNMGSSSSIGKHKSVFAICPAINSSHSISTGEKNPDVVPHDANSDDEYSSEEKAFDRLTTNGGTIGEPNYRILYSPPHLNSPPPLSTASAFTNLTAANKPFGELSLITNPAYALYNTPQRRPPPPLYPSPKPLLLANNTNNSNIYTRVPSRPFVPYDMRLSPDTCEPRMSVSYGGPSSASNSPSPMPNFHFTMPHHTKGSTVTLTNTISDDYS